MSYIPYADIDPIEAAFDYEFGALEDQGSPVLKQYKDLL